jgi:hypothetical protein
MRQLWIALASATFLLTAFSVPAQADFTLLASVNGVSPPRAITGVAWGRWGEHPVGFELEYAGSTHGTMAKGRELHVLSANLLVRGPFVTERTHVYALGGPVYLVDGGQDYDAWSVGLGSKTWLASHIAFRLDYRRYFSGDFARDRHRPNPRRLSAGLSLAF